MIITLSGVDGSGKTTIGKMLVEELRKKGFDVIYRVEFNYFLLGYLKKFINVMTGDRNKADAIRQKVIREKSYPNVAGRIWTYLTFLDLLMEYVYFKIFFKRKVVLMDRCIYDFLIGWKWIGYSTPLMEWLYLRFPHFDLSYVLDIDPRIAFERKEHEQDNDLYFFQTLRGLYKNYFDGRGNIVFLDTAEPIGDLIEKIAKDVDSQIARL